ncbi:hypothetical protein OOT00_08845 [Desulfobotulus sp. H1]|uniref:3-deoxy-D-manno-octulosonic acid transferase n=1 Tax=Desulfobotulus pelophilus TaxID=2823377 RepID=A0ABT3N9F0_9BACT|nr:glycosyltransferase N-terminal domain-containing protein [Desulfobotulus pelophilus]MCW7754093.1 hypothetical protein [Desulfobotulus pelophilus]
MPFSFFSPHVQQRIWPSRVSLPTKKGPLIWIHALSLGEVLSVFPLVDLLMEKRPDMQIFFTVSTRSGMDAAMDSLAQKVADIRYFPLDHPLAVNRMLKDVEPDVFILVETDVWPFFMRAIQKRNIPSLYVNARISQKTFAGYRRLAPVMGPALKAFHSVFPQSSVDAERLLALGLDPRVLEACGNMKHDRSLPDPEQSALDPVRTLIGRQSPSFVWVCGSIHPGEEQVVAEALRHRALEGRKILTFLVPRHPDKAVQFCESLQSMGLDACLLSSLPKDNQRIVVVDCMGILKDLYGLGQAALVGGSFLPLRGHNPLEPAMAGIPVVMGPGTEDFHESWQGLCEIGAGFPLKDGASLAARILFWMDHPEERTRAGLAGKSFVMRGRGTTLRIFQRICSLSGGSWC